MIRVPNTSPLLVLARLDRLDLLGEPDQLVVTAAVLAEVLDKPDEAAARVEKFVRALSPPLDPVISDRVDPAWNLGTGERSVLAAALASGESASCVLDDAAARTEARRLGLCFTGTLGLILRARVNGRLEAAAPWIERAIAAGLYLDDHTITIALARVGEPWPRS